VILPGREIASSGFFIGDSLDVLFSGPKNRTEIALTFDACATKAPSGYDSAVVNTLIRMKTRATLFLGGKWMAEHPKATKKLAKRAQFELANHSYLHPHFKDLSASQIKLELEKTDSTLFALTGRHSTLFRAPYGELDEKVVKAVHDLGYQCVEYSLPSGDPDTTISKERLAQYVISSAHNGAIIVMHMNGRGHCTAAVLPRIIETLTKKGYRFVTVSEMLQGSR
jgi:peptidoglycan/xylan/chitin deacetylase (PgdA/CDA1 family)